MPDRRKALLSGLRSIGPMLPGVIPFGITAGIAALDAGLSPAVAVGMSVLIFAGAAQLTAAQLVDAGAVPIVIVLTALIINLRLAMYSASIAPYLGYLSKRWKWPLAYLLTDQAYALSITRFIREPGYGPRHWFYLGAAFPLWAIWVLATVAGVWMGAAVPPAWQLSFAIPLCFLVLLVPTIRDRPSLIAATVGGGVALLAHDLPMHLGMITGAFSGIVAGIAAEVQLRRRSDRSRPDPGGG